MLTEPLLSFRLLVLFLSWRTRAQPSTVGKVPMCESVCRYEWISMYVRIPMYVCIAYEDVGVCVHVSSHAATRGALFFVSICVPLLSVAGPQRQGQHFSDKETDPAEEMGIVWWAGSSPSHHRSSLFYSLLLILSVVQTVLIIDKFDVGASLREKADFLVLVLSCQWMKTSETIVVVYLSQQSLKYEVNPDIK